MLKLEKVSKTLEINITMRQREHFLNRAFFKALGIALGLHLLAVVLFHIQPFVISGSGIVFPPVLVDSDLNLVQEGTVLAQIDTDEAFPRHIKEPKGLRFAFPEYPEVDLKQYQIQYDPHSNPHVFAPFEDSAQILYTRLLDHRPREGEKVKVEISGSLINLKLEDDGIDQAEFGKTRTGRGRYQVRVEHRTGKIFWYDPIEAIGHEETDALAEKILRGMRFASDEFYFVTGGEIEIQFFRKRPGND